MEPLFRQNDFRVTAPSDDFPDIDPPNPGIPTETRSETIDDVVLTAPRGIPEAELIPLNRPVIGIIMGSVSDWNTMQFSAAMLDQFEVPFEKEIISAHRTPVRLAEYCRSAADRGIQVIIAGAGGAAHLPGMAAAYTTVPVLGVPVESKVLRGVDSLLSIVQMPSGIPVATFAIGEAGAKNAALFAVSILALYSQDISLKLKQFRVDQTAEVLTQRLPNYGDSSGGS